MYNIYIKYWDVTIMFPKKVYNPYSLILSRLTTFLAKSRMTLQFSFTQLHCTSLKLVDNFYTRCLRVYENKNKKPNFKKIKENCYRL